ncbi:MAG: FAD-dependent oxidoreductase [Candidatus Omnitrophica bacterium]|nr:FAD-dependent oxidoreductase [Candidatus Omnitrophota bacterium]
MKILIIGGVAGGAAAAARARRLDERAKIIVLERGEHVSFANCGLPYYAGGVIKERERLLIHTPESLAERFALDIRTRSEALSIDRAKKQVRVLDKASGREYEETYDKLILSPGAAPVRPPIEGADLDIVHTIRTIPDIDAVRDRLDRGAVRRAVVIGGGFIGIEMAENLKERNIETHLIERLDQVMPPFDKDMAVILHRQLNFHGVKLHLKEEVTKIRKTVEGAMVETSSGKTIACDMVIMSVGVRPELKLAREAGIETGKYGIRTSEKMQTSDPDIYAVGDVVEVMDPVAARYYYVPLAWPAAKQGVVAANNICGKEDAYKGTYGTSVVKVFHLTAAMSGATEKTLKDAGIPYEKVYTHPANHAGYYPGAMQMSMKLLFSPRDGKVLGAQIVGHEGTDKRVDVLAVAIKHALTVRDLSELELCYAPPYGSAKDAVILAGMAAVNHLDGFSPMVHWEDLTGKELLLDVRTTDEVDKGGVPGALNIPVDELRKRLGELSKEREIAVFCQVGIRGHAAARILLQNGFKARNVSGGYLTYLNYRDAYILDSSRGYESGPIAETFCTAPTGKASGTSGRIAKVVDACGLQCPGPIVRLKEALASIQPGDLVRITSSDMGFAMDIPNWCKATGNILVNMTQEKEGTVALIMKGVKEESASSASSDKKTTIVVFSGDMDKVMAALIIARSAVSTGKEVGMFFTFWGLNAIKRKGKAGGKKDLLSRMFGMMMPSSISSLKLSKLDMMGIGTFMMKYVMRKKHVMSLPEMLKGAVQDGIEMVACSMSMDVMGIRPEELIDGVKIGGAAYYVANAARSNHNLFI